VNKKIKVIIAGAGALYPIYLGSLLALVEEGYEITSVAGTSGGAIAAATWSLSDVEKKMEPLKKFVVETLPTNNKGVISYSFYNFVKKWGFIDGFYLEKLFERIFYEKMSDAKIPTFIYASDIDRRKSIVFSSVEHGDYQTKKVVRASCSIPLIFTPTKINDKLYVDGGWSHFFPLSDFECLDGENIIGMRIVKSNEKTIKKNIIEYAQGVMYSKIIDDIRQQELPGFFKTIDFVSNYSRANLGKTTNEQASDIIIEGYKQTKETIERWTIENNTKDLSSTLC